MIGSLKDYRTERQHFIKILKFYFDIDFYEMEERERDEWFLVYYKNKKKLLRTNKKLTKKNNTPKLP
jgi:hypothetical protein